MKPSCGCSSRAAAATQSGVYNRPGLSVLSYRAGTYDSFFAAMKDRLSSKDFSFSPATPPLRSLKTRDQDDPAIAILDAWALLADILTFYQERIANEGYLRTATERQSIAALSALVGAALRPGVSASTYLAYIIDPASDSTIPAGSKVQSVPVTGQLPQTFETSQDLSGSGLFSAMAPRLTRPQIPDVGDDLYLTGVNNNVSPNDPLLLNGSGLPRRVATVTLDAPNNQTIVTMQAAGPAEQAAAKKAASLTKAADREMAVTTPVSARAPAPPASVAAPIQILEAVTSLLPSLLKLPALHPATALDLKRNAASVYQPTLDTVPKIVRALNPGASDDLYPALARYQVAPDNPTQLFAFRVKAPVYGHNAPMKPITNAQGIVTGTEEWPLAGSLSIAISVSLSSSELLSEAVIKRFERTSESTESYIKITQGSASAMAPFTSSDTGVQVGGWKVGIEGNLGKGELTLTIPDLRREYKITHTQGKAYQVATGTFSLSALENQSTSFDSDERHLVLAIKESSLLLADNSPATLSNDQLNVIGLDSVYDKIVPGSLVYIERADSPARTMTATVTATAQVSLSSYNMSSRVSQLTLSAPWLNASSDVLLSVARNTTVYAQSALLPLAEKPITDPIVGNSIELGDLYSDLQPSGWLIVSGERDDIAGTSGVQDAELVMLASVKQGVEQVSVPEQIGIAASTASGSASTGKTGGDVTPPSAATAPPALAAAGAPSADATTTDGASTSQPGSSSLSGASPVTPPIAAAKQNRPGESTHSYLQLASPLAYSYKRDTVTIYGNVVQATNGETRKEVIGSGDSSQAFQTFALHASPLTYTSAATPSGIASSLSVYVNGIQWHEADSLAACGTADRKFVTSIDDDNNVTVTFGDGVHGARLPTGSENVQAIYRVGIGSGGNLDTGSLTLLSTKPLGTKAVSSPIIASGGTDRDSAEAGRRNAPLASIALDRLVSVSDYASFARTFAGIGKATSALLPIGNRRTVAVSVTGTEGSGLAAESQVVQQLTRAFLQLGDPNLPIDVLIANPLLLVISARIQTLPDYPWTVVAPMVSAALVSRFSFDTQVPGASVYLSAVTTAIQQVPGVAYTVIDGFDTISRSEVDSSAAFNAKLAQLSAQRTPPASINLQLEHIDSEGNIQPSEIAYLDADLPDTLLLTEIPS